MITIKNIASSPKLLEAADVVDGHAYRYVYEGEQSHSVFIANSCGDTIMFSICGNYAIHRLDADKYDFIEVDLEITVKERKQ